MKQTRRVTFSAGSGHLNRAAHLRDMSEDLMRHRRAALLPMLLALWALALGSAERIGFEIQKLADGRSMVFIPSVPNAFSGITQILPADQVTYLDAPLTQIMEFVERYGHGVDGLLATKVIEPAEGDVDVGEDEAPDE